MSTERDSGAPSDLAEMLAHASSDADRPGIDRNDPGFIAARRRRRKRRIITGSVIALVIAAIVGTYIPVTLQAALPPATLEITTPTVAASEPVSLVLPAVGASAVSVMGATEFEATEGTNGIIASSGDTGALPIASISKLITALVILDAKPIDAASVGPTITFTEADSDLYDKYYLQGAVILPMKAGSTMSEKDALSIMLGASACNYAEAVSTWAYGSQSAFLRATAKWLAANNLTATSMREPTGLDPRNVSSTADLVAIGKLALANPVVAEIVQSPTFDVANVGAFSNTNKLLGQDGINGLKTGTLDEAGACLLFSAVVDVGAAAPLTIVGVVLGGVDHNSVDASVLALLASIESGFHDVPLVAKGQQVGTYSTVWTDDADVVVAETGSVLTWSDTPITSTIDTAPLTTGKDGAEVGSVTFVAGAANLTTPLELSGSIAAPDAWWRLTHPGELFGW